MEVMEEMALLGSDGKMWSDNKWSDVFLGGLKI